MPFYIRKSISAGPFRFNFSKGGVGVSVGIRGLRIGTGPRGHYIHAGTGGLYYRASLGVAGKPVEPAQVLPKHPTVIRSEDVDMIEVDSGDVMLMRDESFKDLLDEINLKSRQVRMASALAWSLGGAGIAVGLLTGGPGLLLTALAIPGWMIGKWLDSYRRSTVLYYDLEGDAEAAYKQIAEGFDGLTQCAGKWHIEAGGAVTSLTAWKRNAGASHLVNKKSTTLSYSLPPVIKSNVTPPALSVGRQIMYFMPDVILVQDGSRIGAVNYRDLNIRWQDSRFIEDGNVPSDARVVGHTWKHPNKSGGPDRRFKNNRQIPICLYETMHFKSGSGVNELVEFSQTGRAESFARGCTLAGQLPKERQVAAPQLIPIQTFPRSEPEAPPSKKRIRLRTVFLSALALFIGFPLVLALSGKGLDRPDASTPTTLKVMEASEPKDTPEDILPFGPSVLPISKLTDNEPRPTATTEITTPVSTLDRPQADEELKSTVLEALVPQSGWYTGTNVNLRDGPGTQHPILSVVANGSPIKVIEQRAGWSRVQIEDGRTGWMTSKAVVAGD